MTNNPNELTIENSTLVLIDHQPAIALAVHSIDHGLLINKIAALARTAKDERGTRGRQGEHDDGWCQADELVGRSR
jgi:hypothetical protein